MSTATTVSNIREAKALAISRFKIALFDGLSDVNFEERAKVIRKIIQLVKTYAKECYPQPTRDITRSNNDNDNNNNNNNNNNNIIITSSLSKRSSVSDDAFNNDDNNKNYDGDEHDGDNEDDDNVNNYVNNSEKNSTPSPIFTDDSTSLGSLSSYNVSPNVNEDVPNHDEKKEEKGLMEEDYDNREVGEDGGYSIEDRKDILKSLILAILRVSIDCPFQDVRYSFGNFLNRLKNFGVPVPIPIHPTPSYFIPPKDILTLEWPQTKYYLSVTTSSTSFLKSSVSSITSSTASSSFDDDYIRHNYINPPPNTPNVFTVSGSVKDNDYCDKETENLITSSIAVKQPDDLTKELLINTFVNFGRLSHLYRVLSYFPGFMEKFQKTYTTIVKNSNVLQNDWKLYIGIMAASQHKCKYLVESLSYDYLTMGGDSKWLESLDNAPRKLKNLSALNSTLAHQPWRLKPKDIARLIRGAKDRQDNWAITEIVHVILLLSTFHSLSSYVLGCGIVLEYDSVGGNCEDVSFNSNAEKAIGLLDDLEKINPDVGAGLGVKLTTDDDSSIHSIKDVDGNDGDISIFVVEGVGDSKNEAHTSAKHTSQLIKRLKNKKDLQLSSSSSINNDVDDELRSCTPKTFRFENCDDETFTNDSPTNESFPFFFTDQQQISSHDYDYSNNAHSQFLSTLSPSILNLHIEDFSRFSDRTVEISYEDFNVNSDEYAPFKLQDYCWKDHGILMVNDFLPDLGELLDDEFQEAKELNDYYCLFPSYTEQANDLNVAKLRQAIWYYVQRLYGFSKDDYHYSNIRELLVSKFKLFLKKVCCTPENITTKDWENVGFQIGSEGKCHVNLIVAESRKQSELIYGLWCVMKCQDGRYDFEDDD